MVEGVWGMKINMLILQHLVTEFLLSFILLEIHDSD